MNRNVGGFTLIELLVATVIVLGVTSAVAALALPMRRAFDRGLSGGDIAARARTALSAVVHELRNAGSGVIIGPPDATLDDVIPVISVVPPSTIAITRATGPQGLLRESVDAGALSVRLDTSLPCSEQDTTCGIRAGDVVAIFDSAKGQVVTVTAVFDGTATLQLASPLVSAFDPGAAIAAIQQTTFTLRARRLVRITGGGAEQPVADRVAAFGAAIVGGRVDLQLTLDPTSPAAASEELRTSVAFRQ
jgi:prepilin-type N-terminal cleavage/methylation domain-containing protein